MIDFPTLIPECNVDTAFVEMCGYRRPNHAPSISQVSYILEQKMSKRRAIGFVDNDKRKPKYFDEFNEIDRTNNARLLKHSNRHHYLVIVNPDMDTFIFNLCKELNIDLQRHNIPRDFTAFVSLTKKESIKNNLQFRNLLNTIRQRNSAEINRIRYWISHYGQV